MDESTEVNDQRPRREARVADFRDFHRTGQTGKVAAAVQKIETPEKEKDTTQTQERTRTAKAKRNLSGDPDREDSQLGATNPVIPSTVHEHQLDMSELEKLREELKQQRELSERLQEELHAAEIRNELQKEKMKQRECQLAKERLDKEKEAAEMRHEEVIKQMHESKADKEDTKATAIEYLKEQLTKLTGTPVEIPGADEAREKAKKQEVADQLKELLTQQKALMTQAQQLAASQSSDPQIQKLLKQMSAIEGEQSPQDEQSKLMDQLLQSLQGREPESKLNKQKEILKQFLVDANKVPTIGGATTLKPEMLKKLTGESDIFNMTEWLSNLNKHRSEEGRCDSAIEECKHHKKSGMLDKATANIQHKEVWPQKNLLEDWADEEIEFKHLQFEHMVAGELRTIETSTDPAEILGRLRLLRKMAYTKLRGYEWPLIRKMYAAILRSIETKEHTWDSNFDRYETILYRKTPIRKEDRTGSGPGTNSKKWFCRDWNKGNCTKSSPHKSWFGTGTNAVQRTVLHMCATCYMKEKTQKEHPEGHESCPHKGA